MPSQILITGATGFIGRRLTRDLVARGDRVRVLARSREKADELFGDHVEAVVGDVRDTASLEAACRGVGTIHHIAGLYRFGLRHRRELWRTNVEGTENLLRSAAAAGVDKVVHLSSGGVLRKSGLVDPVDPAASLLDENDFPAKTPCFSSYKSSKWHAEGRVLSWARRGLPVVIASTTCPIGPGDEIPTPTGQIIRDFLRRRFPFYCRTGLNFIDVGDLSRGLQLAAESGRAGERYLLSGENLWLKEFLDLLAGQTGLPAPRLCLPNALIRLIGFGGEAFDLLNPRSMSARVCLETALQSDRMQFFSNARAGNELGWKPASSIHKSIAEAVAWFRHETEVEPAAAAAPVVESHVQ
ncbi:MAG TPA: NAD-dependent epimerase/dehydratase family protein [Candidatus Methylacidiphilales bacterium]|jgi:dihydroflavonol-4-reductase|nr:NAD-dependent epimerase/dehydratase family protein [Candidatus Methylacidiphilales bacterium]